MRIAIVLVTNWWRASIDLDGYIHGLKRLGCDSLLVCRGNDAGPADFDVVIASEEQQEDANFWKQFDLDAALIFNWLNKPKIVDALNAAGVRTVSRADNEALFSARVFPREAARYYITADNFVDKAKQFKHFLWRYHNESPLEDASVLASCQSSDAIVIETEVAKKNLVKFFNYYRQGRLTQKIHVLPHTVQDSVLDVEVKLQRGRKIFCGGRWDDIQKDAPLLKQTIERTLEKDPMVRFLIAGSGAIHKFETLASSPRVEICDVMPRSKLLNILLDCNFILATSKWESHPIGTLEALCCGCTVVGTPIPGFIDIIGGQRFGTLATSHTPAAMTTAVLEELKQWDGGQRDPIQISSHWKRLVSNEKVTADLLTIVQNLN